MDLVTAEAESIPTLAQRLGQISTPAPPWIVYGREISPTGNVAPLAHAPAHMLVYLVYGCPRALQEIERLEIPAPGGFWTRTQRFFMNPRFDISGPENEDISITFLVVQKLAHLDKRYLGHAIGRVVCDGIVRAAAREQHDVDILLSLA